MVVCFSPPGQLPAKKKQALNEKAKAGGTVDTTGELAFLLDA
jgi:hypothetical protein